MFSETKKNALISMALKAKSAVRTLNCEDTRKKILMGISTLILDNSDLIIKENKKDLDNARERGISPSLIDRLTLNEERLSQIANSLKEVSSLPSPIKTLETIIRPNGLKIKKVAVPIGVIAMIYEARPNVTVDASALSIMSGNSVILRGGKEAINTNIMLVKIIKQAIKECGADDNAVSLIEDTSRESTEILLKMKGYIDLLIPRGSKGLIEKVTEESKIPVIETGAGNCHTYVEASAKQDMAIDVIINAKTSRPSVCNAMEKLLIDESIALEFLPKIKKALDKFNVEFRGCDKTREVIECQKATDEDWLTEYNDYILAVKIVSDYKQAVEHVNKYSTGHSEAILSDNLEAIEYFTENVDAAAVYVNASTRFTDGGEFGLGAEIGISTQKLHVRGPFALEALTTTKYIVTGNGQTR